MERCNIREKCIVNTSKDIDRFVGIKCDAGDFSISFPLGYHLSDDDKELRKDILALISVIGNNMGHKESEIIGDARNSDLVDIPIQSYIYVIKDFLHRGYYKEKEVIYKTAKKGKINWNRTIKTQKPYIQDNDIYYLDFVVKKNSLKENELITLIHEYCVFESFKAVGWLFTSTMPQQPRILRKDTAFISALNEKISNTFNDHDKQLFLHLLRIVQHEGDPDSSTNYKYGTYRFEYVWEKVIDKIFGIKEKDEYFPKTYWKIDGVTYENACLEPDTIMLRKKNVYILDAKYYKYGAESKRIVSFLPESTSINKQITYGEFVATQEKFRLKHGNTFDIYNAFVMPYDSHNNQTVMENIGEAVSDWKFNDEKYQHIQGILLDMKTILRMSAVQNEALMNDMALCIESGFVKE